MGEGRVCRDTHPTPPSTFRTYIRTRPNAHSWPVNSNPIRGKPRTRTWRTWPRTREWRVGKLNVRNDEKLSSITTNTPSPGQDVKLPLSHEEIRHFLRNVEVRAALRVTWRYPTKPEKVWEGLAFKPSGPKKTRWWPVEYHILTEEGVQRVGARLPPQANVEIMKLEMINAPKARPDDATTSQVEAETRKERRREPSVQFIGEVEAFEPHRLTSRSSESPAKSIPHPASVRRNDPYQQPQREPPPSYDETLQSWGSNAPIADLFMQQRFSGDPRPRPRRGESWGTNGGNILSDRGPRLRGLLLETISDPSSDTGRHEDPTKNLRRVATSDAPRHQLASTSQTRAGKEHTRLPPKDHQVDPGTARIGRHQPRERSHGVDRQAAGGTQVEVELHNEEHVLLSGGIETLRSGSQHQRAVENGGSRGGDQIPRGTTAPSAPSNGGNHPQGDRRREGPSTSGGHRNDVDDMRTSGMRRTTAERGRDDRPQRPDGGDFSTWKNGTVPRPLHGAHEAASTMGGTHQAPANARETLRNNVGKSSQGTSPSGQPAGTTKSASRSASNVSPIGGTRGRNTQLLGAHIDRNVATVPGMGKGQRSEGTETGKLRQRPSTTHTPRFIKFLGQEAPAANDLPSATPRKESSSHLPLHAKEVTGTINVDAVISLARKELRPFVVESTKWLRDPLRYESLLQRAKSWKEHFNQNGKSTSKGDNKRDPTKPTTSRLSRNDMEIMERLRKYQEEPQVKAWARVFSVPEWAKRRRRPICEPLLNDYFNEDVPTVRFRTPEQRRLLIAQIRDKLQRKGLETFAMCFDFAAYYDQLPLTEEVAKFFGVKSGGKSWTSRTIPMGFRPSCATAQACTWAIVDFDVEDVIIITYIDNVAFIGSEAGVKKAAAFRVLTPPKTTNHRLVFGRGIPIITPLPPHLAKESPLHP